MAQSMDFRVEAQHLHLTHAEVMAGGTIRFLRARVEFGDGYGWEHVAKKILFKRGDHLITRILDEDGLAKDINLPEGGHWSVGVKGYAGSAEDETNVRITTDTLRIYVANQLIEEGEEPTPEDETIFEQALSIVKDARDIAQSVRDDADNGVFNGSDYDHSEEYTRLHAEMEEYASQVAQDRSDIHDQVGIAEGAAATAVEASGVAVGARDEAEGFAERAERAAEASIATHGMMSFRIDENGNLQYEAADNMSRYTWTVEEGRLMVAYD